MAFADLSDVRCYYELLGDGPALLMIPGLGKTCRLWDEVARDFAKDFTLIMPDLRGTGWSRTLRPASHLSHYAADLTELLDFLQLDSVHVLGLSFGGVVAQRVAVDHASRVDRLILISCTDRFTSYLHQQAHLLAMMLRKMPSGSFARAVELFGSSPLYFDEHAHDLEEKAARETSHLPRTAILQQLRCLGCSQISEDRYAISAPTLVIAGDNDSLIPSCYAKAMAGRIPGSKFVLLEGVGHNPLEESPGQTVEIVRSFLKSRVEVQVEEAICP